MNTADKILILRQAWARLHTYTSTADDDALNSVITALETAEQKLRDHIDGHQRILERTMKAENERDQLREVVKQQSQSTEATLRGKPPAQQFVIIEPYQSVGDVAFGMWSDKHQGYMLGDGDIYTADQLAKCWPDAVLLTWSELEYRLKLPAAMMRLHLVAKETCRRNGGLFELQAACDAVDVLQSAQPTKLPDWPLCSVCGQPLTESVNYSTANLSERWHVRCNGAREVAKRV